MTETGLDIRVANNPGELRYEVFVGDELAGFTTYTLHEGTVQFMHAEVFSQWEGHGVGSRLARDALDDVVAAGKTITPLCPFIVDYISRHPGYLANVDEPHRQEIEARIATEDESA